VAEDGEAIHSIPYFAYSGLVMSSMIVAQFDLVFLCRVNDPIDGCLSDMVSNINVFDFLGAPDPDDPDSYLKSAFFEMNMNVLDEVENMEERVYGASLQIKVSMKSLEELRLIYVKLRWTRLLESNTCDLIVISRNLIGRCHI
jgi:hypothetical protein